MAKFNEYPAKTIPKDADKFMLYSAEDSANKLIDYDKLADAVLDKLTSKTFGLDAGTMTLPAALNQLNSKFFFDIRNLSTFSVQAKLEKENYTSFLMYGSTSANNGFMYIVFVNNAAGKRQVSFIKIADFAATRTFSGTYSDDSSTLTINSNETIWGGIKLLMIK